MSPFIALVGLTVGFLVGLTGVAGGSLLTPILVLIGVPVPTAVGTDLVYNIGTKLMGTFQHWRQGSVDWRWVAALSVGGVPLAVAGSLMSRVVARDRALVGLLPHALGAMLILAALSTGVLEAVRWWRSRSPVGTFAPPKAVPPSRLVPLGAAIGFLVGLTSIGSGSLIAPALLLWSGLSARHIVGTDIGNALFLTMAAGIAHATMGSVDFHMVLNLLVGSIPGAWIGSRMTLYVPSRPLRTVVSGFVFLSGLHLL